MRVTEIGKVLKPQGLKGQIKVHPFDPSFFDELKKVDIKNQTFAVKFCAVRQGFAYVDLDGIDSIEKAEQLRDAILKAEVMLQSDEFLTDEIIGFAIVSKSGKILGRLRAVNNYGSTDIFDCGNYSFPFVDEFVVRIDKQKKQIVVNEKMLEEEIVL